MEKGNSESQQFITPAPNAQLLGRLKAVAESAGCSLFWNEYMTEIGNLVIVYGEEFVSDELRKFADSTASHGYKWIDWVKFKQFKLDSAPTLQQKADEKKRREEKKVSTVAFSGPPKKNTHPLPKYDLDAWQYMLSMQRGEEPINDMTINKLQWKLESYNGTATKDAVSRYIADYRSGVDLVAKSTETGRDPDIIIQLRVLNWFAEETKVVPEYFKDLLATVKQTHVRELCERKIKERLTQPLPIKRRNPVNNLFKSVTAQYIKPVVEVIKVSEAEKQDKKIFNDIMQGDLKLGNLVIDVQPLPTEEVLDKEEQQQDELANYFEISGREPLSTVDIPF